MENKKHLVRGVIVFKHGTYYFQNSRGDMFQVLQNEETKKLYESQQICLLEVGGYKGDSLFGNIVEVFGKSGDPIPEGRAIAKAYGLIREPSEDVLREVKKLPYEVPESMKKGITDLRDVPFVTIDPDTAKDFDDAVFAERNEDGTITLRVAIANVAAFVKKDSALFDYGMENGNSAYLGDTCYPMFPEKLSNGICSLNEGVDRIVMCTTCTVKSNGELTGYKIEPAVINSKNRLTYKEADYLYFGENAVGDDIDHSAVKDKVSDEVMASLEALYDVASDLYHARMKRGAFDIDAKKLRFKLAPNGIDVIGYEKDHYEQFTSVIEETAILTNEIWGEVAENFNIPFQYRNHKSIDYEEMYDLRNQLKPFNIDIPKGASTQTLQKVIDSVKGKRIEEFVVSSILKAMESAYYNPENIGHAGLAIIHDEFRSFHKLTNGKDISKDKAIEYARKKYFNITGRHNGLSFIGDISHSAYAQSTSPIRRGSDLLDQIQMLEFLNTGNYTFKTRELMEYADHLNSRERSADRAEKEYDDMLSAKWGADNMGKIFPNCHVVALNENEAKVVTPDGYRMNLPYDASGIKRKYLKIGSKIGNAQIDKVTICPPRVVCTTKILEKKNEEELEIE